MNELANTLCSLFYVKFTQHMYPKEFNNKIAKAYHTCEKIVADRTEELEEKNSELRRLITRDALTNAFSRRYIMKTLESTFLDLHKTTGDFSLISFDLDFFKQVNDQYGHAEAMVLAEKIRKAIKSVDYTYMNKSFNITCSLALVTMNDTMTDYDDMLIQADQLLYKAKKKGRDQVCS